MSAILKKKLCWNCEGRVSLEEENCPYCAVYLGPAPGEEGDQDILAPPYRLVESEEEEKVPQSPYAVEQEEEEEGKETEIDLSGAKRDLKKVIVPLALLSAGSLFFLFGLILLIFSSQGVFTLSWNAKYWYFYLVFALPLLLFGWKSLQRNDEDEEDKSSDLISESHL